MAAKRQATPPLEIVCGTSTEDVDGARLAAQISVLNQRQADEDSGADSAQPIYLRIAKTLKSAIADGRYPVGARLPTEAQLCERFGISRFTARAAVKTLLTSGLVTRRQRVGTVVIATPDDARYTHDATTVSDLFQYAHETKLRLAYIGRIASPWTKGQRPISESKRVMCGPMRSVFVGRAVRGSIWGTPSA